ncbi:protein serine threonine kinase [Tyrophagus putrescentiae]|nr:protein serine threonine kinase [Tyrophagus putrescentiae]
MSRKKFTSLSKEDYAGKGGIGSQPKMKSNQKKVFEASNTALRKPQVALKVINTSNLTSEEREVDLPKELTALMEVKHRYVVRVYDIFCHHEHVFIFMELADGGDLAIYRWHHRPLREALVASWFQELAEALAYFHLKIAFAHRDVKLCNLLLLDRRMNTKLCNFGFAFYGSAKLALDAQFSTDISALRRHVAAAAHEGAVQPYKADIFATGRDYPQFLRLWFPQTMSAKAKALIELMLHPVEESQKKVSLVSSASVATAKTSGPPKLQV